MLQLTPEIVDAWVKALRSGDYNQIKFNQCRNLKNKEMCVYGVLFDVLSPDTWVQNGLESWNNKVVESTFQVLTTRIRSQIMSMNDEGQQSFDVIANFIEQHKEELL